MFANLFHRLIVYTAIGTAIITVWTVAWARAITAEADRGVWPALPVPQHVAGAASPHVDLPICTP